MKNIFLIFYVIFKCNVCFSQSTFIKPWLDKSPPIIIDVYEENDYNIKIIKKDSNIKAIIHKMSEESHISFVKRRLEAYRKTNQFISPYNSYLFVTRIFERTGRYPHIYRGVDNLNKLINSEYKETFKQCKLWLIALTQNGDITKIMAYNKIWKNYSLWQFSCEINCCKEAKKTCFYKVKGIDCYMDYDVYNGSFEDLKKNWGK